VLLRSLFAGATVGISWGRTVRAVVDQLPVPDVAIDDVTVVALCGGIGSTRPDIMSNTVVLELASKLKAKAAVLNAPVVVQNRAVLNTLKHEPSIEPVLRLAKSCHIALVGIGAVGQFSTLTTLKHLTAAELRDITRTGAVGDVCSRFYTADGVAIDSDLNRRTMGIDLADLKKIPRVIAVAWGSEKTQAVLGALRMGIVNVLVTDRVVAEGILHHLQSV
jgi:DNA-binding transcriptional regulator LsrR (DeoR family)